MQWLLRSLCKLLVLFSAFTPLVAIILISVYCLLCEEPEDLRFWALQSGIFEEEVICIYMYIYLRSSWHIILRLEL